MPTAVRFDACAYYPGASARPSLVAEVRQARQTATNVVPASKSAERPVIGRR
jgi:hypothetical protein